MIKKSVYTATEINKIKKVVDAGFAANMSVKTISAAVLAKCKEIDAFAPFSDTQMEALFGRTGYLLTEKSTSNNGVRVLEKVLITKQEAERQYWASRANDPGPNLSFDPF